jgi:hypothetical protein
VQQREAPIFVYFYEKQGSSPPILIASFFTSSSINSFIHPTIQQCQLTKANVAIK